MANFRPAMVLSLPHAVHVVRSLILSGWDCETACAAVAERFFVEDCDVTVREAEDLLRSCIQ